MFITIVWQYVVQFLCNCPRRSLSFLNDPELEILSFVYSYLHVKFFSRYIFRSIKIKIVMSNMVSHHSNFFNKHVVSIYRYVGTSHVIHMLYFFLISFNIFVWLLFTIYLLLVCLHISSILCCLFCLISYLCINNYMLVM